MMLLVKASNGEQGEGKTPTLELPHPLPLPIAFMFRKVAFTLFAVAAVVFAAPFNGRLTISIEGMC